MEECRYGTMHFNLDTGWSGMVSFSLWPFYLRGNSLWHLLDAPVEPRYEPSASMLCWRRKRNHCSYLWLTGKICSDKIEISHWAPSTRALILWRLCRFILRCVLHKITKFNENRYNRFRENFNLVWGGGEAQLKATFFFSASTFTFTGERPMSDKFLNTDYTSGLLNDLI
jgi:hypothetical protein